MAVSFAPGSASAATVSGVFVDDPVFSNLLLAEGNDVVIPAGESKAFTTLLFPVAAEFDVDASFVDGSGSHLVLFTLS